MLPLVRAGGTLPQPCVMPEAVGQIECNAAMACSIPRAGITNLCPPEPDRLLPAPPASAGAGARTAALCLERLWLSLENWQPPHAAAIMSKRPFVLGSGDRMLGEGSEAGAGPSLQYHSLLWAMGLSLWSVGNAEGTQGVTCLPGSPRAAALSHLPAPASPAVPVVSLPLLSSCPGCFNNIMYAKIIYLCIK